MSISWWKKFDWILFGATIALVVLGLLMLLSTTLHNDQPYARNQALFIIIGLTLYFWISNIDYKWFIQASPVIYASTILLLIIVAVFAQVTRGAASWLDFGPFSLQPSEFAKLAVVLIMARTFMWVKARDWGELRLLGMYIAVMAFPVGLILLQPDLGTALVVLAGWIGVVWMSPLSKRIMAGLLTILISIVITGWLFLAEYQKQRILTFLNPAADPLGSGYNVLQSIIAVGSGMWLGQGWGRGTQSHLNFLPEHHTDFIFASLSEEFGFVGSLLTIILFGLILWRGARMLWRAQDQQTVLIVSGILVMLFFQAGVNVAMNVGMAPVTGVPLPLVSYGGSSLIATLISLGVLQSIAVKQADR